MTRATGEYMDKQNQTAKKQHKQKKRVITALITLAITVIIPLTTYNIFEAVIQTDNGVIIISTILGVICLEIVSMIMFLVNLIAYLICLMREPGSVETTYVTTGCEACRYASVYTDGETKKVECSMGHDTEGRNSYNCEDFCSKDYVFDDEKGRE